MENKINIAELLKDCPCGMELDCTMYDDCTFEGIEDVGYIDILVKTPSGIIRLTKEGCYFRHDDYAKCVIFPKGKTTWEGFQRPFKDGDILSNGISIFIYNGNEGDKYYGCYVAVGHIDFPDYFIEQPQDNYSSKGNARLATEEEKQKLFDAIKANGYRWNAETKTLEKVSKFKKEEPMKTDVNDNKTLLNMSAIDYNNDLVGYEIPVGYEFDTVIDNKVVLKKSKPLFPKTYEECCKILGCKANHFFTDFSYNGLDIEISDYEDKIDDLLKNFRKLRYCRDAYWKIVGEQMGLGKSWEPDWSTVDDIKYVIEVYRNNVRKNSQGYSNTILAFPTSEMRDAFYENFKELIEQCKELL
mgnify:CR=1 FL=1